MPCSLVFLLKLAVGFRNSTITVYLVRDFRPHKTLRKRIVEAFGFLCIINTFDGLGFRRLMTHSTETETKNLCKSDSLKTLFI